MSGNWTARNYMQRIAAQNLDDAEPATCRDCQAVIHDGNTCIECWRDRRTLAIERDREWWAS